MIVKDPNRGPQYWQKYILLQKKYMAEKNLQYALMRIWSHWCQFGWNTGSIGVDVNQNVEPLMPIWMSESNTKAIATNSDHNVEPLMPMWIKFQYSECQYALYNFFLCDRVPLIVKKPTWPQFNLANLLHIIRDHPLFRYTRWCPGLIWDFFCLRTRSVGTCFLL